MKTTSFYLKIAVPLFALAILTAAPKASGDTYSWTNFQSDIAGVAQHVDENLVNPWGMAVSPNGTIWVSDNGTGVSTLYGQDGTARSLVVTIPTAARNREGGNPTGRRLQWHAVLPGDKKRNLGPCPVYLCQRRRLHFRLEPERGPDKRHYRR